ncbi:oncostatin-M-specific receptor subunit beta isoform X2 [Thalassophryne amazonica]|uniref:oncostatin-M-specific receptor subunit beta isoform X2 n=1 Tax=Thalassophryne amazonica TaxID=390379 RepID=UPI0014710B33|nr:oncostatin-M-specific receptor subunit beta isoform X2 [Thalassophryne amazonica]
MVLRMASLSESFFCLLGFLLMFSVHTDSNPPRPIITHLQAVSKKQRLSVSWLVHSTSLPSQIYELQIGRTENFTVIYSTNVSVVAVDSDEYTWTWTSALPLECVDHSVRIRHIYNQSLSSAWSQWITRHGTKAEKKTLMFPFQRILREGARVQVCCVPPAGLHVSSMAFSSIRYPLISIGDRVKAITVNNLTIPSSDIKARLFSCSVTRSNPTHIWNYISFPPQKPRNLSCGTPDMMTVTCVWDSGRKRDPYDHNKQTYTLRVDNTEQPPVRCQQSSCSFAVVPELEEYRITVEVKDQLGEEMESYSFSISDRVFPDVALDAVTPGVTDTIVSWIIPGNLTQQDLFCEIITEPPRATMVRSMCLFVHQDGVHFEPSVCVRLQQQRCQNMINVCKIKLENLLPSTHYSTTVRCAIVGGHWGEWTEPALFTTHPLVTLDLWRKINQVSYPYVRQVTLMWTPHVAGSAVTVNIQGYTVQWLQGSRNWTERKNGGQTQTDISIGPERYDFFVQAVIHAGSSVPAHIVIPQVGDTENLPVPKWLNTSTAAGFTLSWAEQDKATCGYTVEWCALGNAVPCILQWMKVPQGNSALRLPAQNFKAGCRYTFNIYTCSENVYKLLEIQTGYSQELRTVPPVKMVQPVHSTSSSVTLRWSFNEHDPAHPAFITGYLVTVHEVASDKLLDHTATVLSVLVSDPQRNSVVVEGLQENQKYTISLSALTKKGPGSAVTVTITTRTNYSALLPKILIPVLLLLSCTILLWHQRRMLQSLLNGIFAYPTGMNIKIPELDSFLHESERLQSEMLDECVSSNIEVLHVRPTLNQMTPACPPAPQCSASACLPLHTDYCAQSALWEMSVINKSYFQPTEEDVYSANKSH